MRRIVPVCALIFSFTLLIGCSALQPNNSQADNQNQESQQQETRQTEQEPQVSGEPVAVQQSIPFGQYANVRQAVKDECELQTKTPNFVQEFGRRNGINVQLVDDLDATDIDRKLELTITEVHAPGGGAYSGYKYMIVDGTLYENGREVANVKSRRNTSGGAFAQFKSTCAIIGRSTEAIGQDMANWLENPQDGVRLGDL